MNTENSVSSEEESLPPEIVEAANLILEKLERSKVVYFFINLIKYWIIIIK